MNPPDVRCAWAMSLVLSLPLAGCDVPIPTDELRVAAASDLQAAMPELVRQYERERPDYKVVVTFGSSGKLAEQIRAGARFDLFLAANEFFVKSLADENLVKPESIRPYAIGSLALALRRDASIKVHSVADLTKPEVKRVAIANPDLAPYGAAARQALKKAGVWEQVEPKLVLADSVRQAFLFVETGNADVALVGRASTKGSDVGVVAVDRSLYEPIVQGLGFVLPVFANHDPEPFAQFLTGPKGRSILETYGFHVPRASAP